jgi:Rrf2 family protein
MELSSRVEYALSALLELANHQNSAEPLRVKDVASKQGIPNRYLEHIFITLRRAGLVHAQRGIKGGYLLARKPYQITMFEVFECFEGTNELRHQDSLSLNRSIVRETWNTAQQTTKEMLKQLTLQDLCHQRDEREQLNSMYYI